jgi:kumamolisin
MSSKPGRITIRGSEKAPLADARAVGPVQADERMEVTIRLRSKNPLSTLSANHVADDVTPNQRSYLSRAELADAHGADPQDVAKVVSFAQGHQLVVVETNPDQRSLVLSGTTASFNAAFGTSLQNYEHAEGTFRGRVGSLTVPSDLEGIIEGIFGLDDRPQARPHYQRHQKGGIASEVASPGSFTPTQLASLYNFPSGLDGSGQCIGLIELDGGFRPADIRAYFSGLGLPTPNVKAVRIDGGRNHPTNANSADGEVMLDIEVAAAIAPKATIVVYFAPNTSQGFLDAVNKAVHDNTHKPSVISISWGSAESNWTVQSMTALDQAFQAAAAVGVTVCVAAGDNGSSDGVNDNKAHVDFPASSPFTLGCGGTKLVATGQKIASETVWNESVASSATGGGVSDQFPLPTYQHNARVPVSANSGGKAGRGVPDVSADADPATGYQVRVDGQNAVFGGTSAVAPLYAGLLALMNQKIGKPVGFLNPLIYGSLSGKGLFNDVTLGNNGAYNAAAGWDACTGWGSAVGAKLLAALNI